MVQLTLPRNSQVKKGKRWAAPPDAKSVQVFRVYRYDPEVDANPRWDEYEVSADDHRPDAAGRPDPHQERPSTRP